MGTMATPARHLRIPDDVWLPAQDVAWRRRTSVTAMVTGFLRSEVMTAEILAEPGALEEIRAAEAAVAAGDVVRGAEAVRALRPRPAAVKIITDERVPPGMAGLIGPDHDGEPQMAVMANLGPESPVKAPRRSGGPAAAREPATGAKCSHPKARVIKGYCGACGTHVG